MICINMVDLGLIRIRTSLYTLLPVSAVCFRGGGMVQVLNLSTSSLLRSLTSGWSIVSGTVRSKELGHFRLAITFIAYAFDTMFHDAYFNRSKYDCQSYSIAHVFFVIYSLDSLYDSVVCPSPRRSVKMATGRASNMAAAAVAAISEIR